MPKFYRTTIFKTFVMRTITKLDKRFKIEPDEAIINTIKKKKKKLQRWKAAERDALDVFGSGKQWRPHFSFHKRVFLGKRREQSSLLSLPVCLWLVRGIHAWYIIFAARGISRVLAP